jgi:hypothetical protein
LERDEGEYGYAGQLLLQGVAPYQLAYNMKFPAPTTPIAVSLALFGQTAWGIRVGLLLANAGTTLLLFLLARRLTGGTRGADRGGRVRGAVARPLDHGPCSRTPRTS